MVPTRRGNAWWERAPSQASLLTSLRLYGHGDWGGELFEEYGPHSHARTRGGRHHPPQFIVPEEAWWLDQANAILRRAYSVKDKDYRLDQRSASLSTPSSDIECLVEAHMRGLTYFGKLVSDSLPVQPSRFHAKELLFSAIIITYTFTACLSAERFADDRGLGRPAAIQHLVEMADSCFQMSLDRYLDFKGPRHRSGFNLFQCTAMRSAARAADYLQSKQFKIEAAQATRPRPAIQQHGTANRRAQQQVDAHPGRARKRHQPQQREVAARLVGPSEPCSPKVQAHEVQQWLQARALREQLSLEEAPELQARARQEANHRERQQLRLQLHGAASAKLHREYAARQTRDHWLRYWVFRHRRAKRRALCSGTVSCARRVRAASVIQTWLRRTARRALLARWAAYLALHPAEFGSIQILAVSRLPAEPELASSTKKGNFYSLDRRDTRRALGSSKSKPPQRSKRAKQLEREHPLRDRGQQLPRRKRQQRNRRPRRQRPSKQFREEHPLPAPRQFGFPSSSRGARVGHKSRYASAADSRQDFSWPQAPDTANVKPSCLDSANLLVPNSSFASLPDDPVIAATTPMEAITYHCDRERDPFRQKEVLPLAIFSAQSHVAHLEFHLGMATASCTRLLLPATAASIIQRCYQRHCQEVQRRISAASCIERWARAAISRARVATRRHAAARKIQTIVRRHAAHRHSVARRIQQFVRRQQSAIPPRGLALARAAIADFSLLASWAPDAYVVTRLRLDLQYVLRYRRNLVWYGLDVVRPRLQRCLVFHDLRRMSAASAIQHWHRRTSRRQLFRALADALCFKSSEFWQKCSLNAISAIARILDRQQDKLSSDFVLSAAHTWLLPVIERHFPGINSPCTLVPVPSLRARAYSMTADYLAYNAVAWATSGEDEWTFAATLVGAAGSILRTARGLPSSSALDLSVDFASAQLSIDRARKATSSAFDLPSHITLDSFADPSVADNAEENVLGYSISEKSTLEPANAEDSVLDPSFESKASVERALNHARAMLGRLESNSSQLDLAITASATSPFDWILHGLQSNTADATQEQQLLVAKLERQLSSIELELMAQRLSWCSDFAA